MQKISILSACFIASGAFAQNLLVNGDFSSGNIGFTNEYTFVASGQSTLVGTYGIRTLSTDFNSGYNSFGDHTTGSGNMLLLDGSGTAAATVWSETVTVQTNGNYAFSGWAASSDGSNPAQLTFTVNGTPLTSPLTLSTTGGLWQKFSFAWNSGTATSAQIAIADLTTIDLGNDFALDDLAFVNNTIAPFAASIFTSVEIDWSSQTSVNYQVQYATALAPTTWINLGSPVAGTGATLAVFDSSHSNPQRFYRIQALP